MSYLLALTVRAATDNLRTPRLAAVARMQIAAIELQTNEQLFDHEADTPRSDRNPSE